MRYDDELKGRGRATFEILNWWFKGSSQLENVLEFRFEWMRHTAMDNRCNIVVDKLQTTHVVTSQHLNQFTLQSPVSQ